MSGHSRTLQPTRLSDALQNIPINHTINGNRTTVDFGVSYDNMANAITDINTIRNVTFDLSEAVGNNPNQSKPSKRPISIAPKSILKIKCSGELYRHGCAKVALSAHKLPLDEYFTNSYQRYLILGECTRHIKSQFDFEPANDRPGHVKFWFVKDDPEAIHVHKPKHRDFEGVEIKSILNRSVSPVSYNHECPNTANLSEEDILQNCSARLARAEETRHKASEERFTDASKKDHWKTTIRQFRAQQLGCIYGMAQTSQWDEDDSFLGDIVLGSCGHHDCINDTRHVTWSQMEEVIQALAKALVYKNELRLGKKASRAKWREDRQQRRAERKEMSGTEHRKNPHAHSIIECSERTKQEPKRHRLSLNDEVLQKVDAVATDTDRAVVKEQDPWVKRYLVRREKETAALLHELDEERADLSEYMDAKIQSLSPLRWVWTTSATGTEQQKEAEEEAFERFIAVRCGEIRRARNARLTKEYPEIELARMLNHFNFGIRHNECVDCGEHGGYHVERCPNRCLATRRPCRSVGDEGFEGARDRLPGLDLVEAIMGWAWVEQQVFGRTDLEVAVREKCAVCGSERAHRVGCPLTCRYCGFVGHETDSCRLQFIMDMEAVVEEEEVDEKVFDWL